MTQDLALKGGQESFHARRGAVAGVGLRGDAVTVVLDSELGHLAFSVAIVEDEQREAGVAEQAPGLGRVRRTSQRKEGGVLLTTEIQDQARKGGE